MTPRATNGAAYGQNAARTILIVSTIIVRVSVHDMMTKLNTILSIIRECSEHRAVLITGNIVFKLRMHMEKVQARERVPEALCGPSIKLVSLEPSCKGRHKI